MVSLHKETKKWNISYIILSIKKKIRSFFPPITFRNKFLMLELPSKHNYQWFHRVSNLIDYRIITFAAYCHGRDI